MTRLSLAVAFSLAFLLMATTACSDLLSPDPTSEITVASFWESPGDARGGLYGMYERLRGQAANNLHTWGASRSEELSYGLQASEGRERYFENTISADFAGPNWLRLYTTIHDANLLIKYVPGIEFNDTAEQDAILAQAHAMRAYIYFIIARTWGDAPLITEPTEGFDPQTTFRGRDDVGEIFDQIKDDLDQAISLFSSNDLPNCRCEWSRPATNALKGNVYLWTGQRRGGGDADFQTALQALETSREADVGLLDDFESVFAYDNKGNREILMAVHFSELESGGNWNSSMYIRDDQILASINEETRALLGTGGGLNRWGPSEVLREQFSEDDTRREATFVEAYTTDEGGDESFYASVVRKYSGSVISGSRIFADDIVLFRYADVLLMIAEAKNALGMDPSSEINMVRERAYDEAFSDHTFTSGSMEENAEVILEERLRELAFEGKRWWDLVRFDKAFELVPSLADRQGEQHLLLWPIPQSVIAQNSSIEQNPGY